MCKNDTYSIGFLVAILIFALFYKNAQGSSVWYSLDFNSSLKIGEKQQKYFTYVVKQCYCPDMPLT